jgi:hypothetical protein
MEAVVETTVWNDSNKANHTYLLDGTKMVAYIKVGSITPVYFKNPITIDKRGRKFTPVKPNPFQVVKVTSTLSTLMKKLVRVLDTCIVELVNT